MKKLIVILILILAVSAVFAKKANTKKIPSDVKLKFESLYPQAAAVKWTKEEANYEAEFRDKDVETSVVIDSKGNLLETEQEIPLNTLPESVTNYITSAYPGKKITEAAKITDAKGTITYEAEVGRKDLIFDANGKIVE